MSKVFSIASDSVLIDLINRAKHRLTIIAPGLSLPVAKAAVSRMGDIPNLALTIVLDSDEEIYRMGYGDVNALKVIRSASDVNMFDLREQEGIRICLFVSDHSTLIFSPVSRNIEAGSTSDEKPNAILIEGNSLTSLERALGLTGEPMEIGKAGIETSKINKMLESLEKSPPLAFDLTRKLKVYMSAVEFVELKLSGYKLSRRKVALPTKFLKLNSANLERSISAQVTAPFSQIKFVKVEINNENGKIELDIDEKLIDNMRKEIEEEFTFQIAKKGRLILKRDRMEFDKRVRYLEVIIKAYTSELKKIIETLRVEFINDFVTEYSEMWKSSAEAKLEGLFIGSNYEQNSEKTLVREAEQLFNKMVEFSEPEIILNYKGIVIEDIKDHQFRADLEDAMKKRNVDKETLSNLFDFHDAAQATG